MEKIDVEASDGLKLKCLYSKAEKAKALIVIVHGMVEHKERYIPLIEELNKNNYTVIIGDLRGHGESVNEEYSLGRIASIDQMVDDTNRILEYGKRHNPNIDVYMYAHSMGTLIARMYIREYSFSIKKLIISGTVSYKPGCFIGVALAKMKSGGKGKYKYSKLLFRFSNNNSASEDVSWLSYNEENVKNYMEDPLCGYKFTNYSNYILFSMTHRLHKHNRKNSVNGNLKIMSISGEDDRTTGGTKGVKDSLKHLIMDGFTRLSYREYPHMKHEILAEEGVEKIYSDIVKFYDED